MLDKHFMRQGKSLYVFRRHKERGCGWQGELRTLDNHVPSCTMTDAPRMAELLKLQQVCTCFINAAEQFRVRYLLFSRENVLVGPTVYTDRYLMRGRNNRKLRLYIFHIV